MRNTARFATAAGAALGAAALLLLSRCGGGTTIQATGSPGSVQINPPPDSPEVRVQPTWEIQPTRLPTATPTPIA
jgi:hypothetical protein